MRRFGFLIMLALVLTCATGVFAWYDDFNGYTTGGGDISSNWTVPGLYEPMLPFEVTAVAGGTEPGGLAATSTTGGNPGAFAYRLTGAGTGVLTGKVYIGTAATPFGGGRIGLFSGDATTTPWQPDSFLSGALMNLYVYKNGSGRPLIDFDEYAADGTLAYAVTTPALAGSTDWMDLMVNVGSGGSYSVSYKYEASITWTQLVAPRTTSGGWVPDKAWIAPAQGPVDDVGFLSPGSATAGVSGAITLQDVQSGADRSLTKIRVELRTHGTTTVLRAVIIKADGSGNFSYSFSPLEAGSYDVAVYCPGFLRKVTAVTVATGQAVTQNVSLINGDVNGDNQVDSTDKTIVQGNLDSAGGQ